VLWRAAGVAGWPRGRAARSLALPPILRPGNAVGAVPAPA